MFIKYRDILFNTEKIRRVFVDEDNTLHIEYDYYSKQMHATRFSYTDKNTAFKELEKFWELLQ